jgi:hypothetical protein
MKSLSNICILLWVIPYFGKQLFPDIFGHWYIVWPSFGLLSILLPFGFAKSISNKSDHKFAFTFLLLFMINIFLNGVGLNLLKSTNTYLEVPLQIPLIKENSSLAAINNENPEVRKVVAQFIYKEFGQPIMFKNKLGEFVVYQPTDEDKKGFSEKHATGVQSKEIIKYTTSQITQTIYSLGWACGCFLIIFIVVFRREQCKANKQINQD